MQSKNVLLFIKNEKDEIEHIISDHLVLGFSFDDAKKSISYKTENGIFESIYVNEKEFKKDVKELTRRSFPSLIQTQYQGSDFYLIFDRVSILSKYENRTKVIFKDSYEIMYLDEDIVSLSNKV